jgi:hypothetical protein
LDASVKCSHGERAIGGGFGGRLSRTIGGVGEPEFMDLRNADAADRIAFHVAKVIESALDSLPDEDRAAASIRLARYLIDEIAGKTNAQSLVAERPIDSLQMLRAIRSHLPDGSFEHIESPLIPLLDTALLTNAPGEPRVGRQIQAEIASSDRIDVIMAFIRRTGIAPLRDDLKRHELVKYLLARGLNMTRDGRFEDFAIVHGTHGIPMPRRAGVDRAEGAWLHAFAER